MFRAMILFKIFSQIFYQLETDYKLEITHMLNLASLASYNWKQALTLIILMNFSKQFSSFLAIEC